MQDQWRGPSSKLPTEQPAAEDGSDEDAQQLETGIDLIQVMPVF